MAPMPRSLRLRVSECDESHACNQQHGARPEQLLYPAFIREVVRALARIESKVRVVTSTINTWTSSTTRTKAIFSGSLCLSPGITMKYDEILHVVVQGDFGYLHSNGHFGGEAYTFHDLFRVSDGKCVEHWDVMVPAK